MKPYAAHGKQVQRNGEHVADAADETWAQIIADALNDRVERATASPTGVDAFAYLFAGMPVEIDPAMPSDAIEFRHPDGRIDMPHIVSSDRVGDYSCTCGRHWDRDDGDECPGATS